MTDEPEHAAYERERTGVPRWVKLAAIVVAVVALVAVVVMLAGGGGHTPRRHGPPADPTSAPTADGGHMPPPGVHGRTGG